MNFILPGGAAADPPAETKRKMIKFKIMKFLWNKPKWFELPFPAGAALLENNNET